MTWIVPSFFTKLLVFIVTAAPLVGLTDPVLLIRMSPDALVVCGVVTAVEMTVSAWAGNAIVAAAIAPKPVVASRNRIKSPFVSPLQRCGYLGWTQTSPDVFAPGQMPAEIEAGFGCRRARYPPRNDGGL
ncbi:MAG TPA: hypothetical protein VFI12_01765 [Thermomicrobiales bacterium]|nr:hypothetical protein [Thermomicrobiales bacterium]